MPLHLDPYVSPLDDYDHVLCLIYDYFNTKDTDYQIVICEGFDWQKEKLEQVIHTVCKLIGINTNQVSVFQDGFYQSSSDINFLSHNQGKFLKLFADNLNGKYFEKKLQYHFLSMINRPTWDRIAIVSFLNYYYANSSKLKFILDKNFISHGIGVDEYIKNYFQHRSYMDILQKFLTDLPIDSVLEPWSIKELTTVMTNDSQYNSSTLYSQCAIEIVSETTISKNFFVTEKTARPIAYYTPFIVMGSKNFLSNLRNLGFKTFGNYWDESYDQYEGKERLEKIYQTINNVSHFNLYDLHTATFETCVYNKSVLDSYSWKKKFNSVN